MTEYKLSVAEQADQLEAEAAATFNEGKAAYEQSGAYVLNTVFLATVLLLITISYFYTSFLYARIAKT